MALRGLCQHEGRYALVMEYCPRGTLDVLLHHTASKHMEVSRLLLLIRSIARGMLHLHTRRPPILHRDLKPANIFVGALPPCAQGTAAWLVEAWLAHLAAPQARQLPAALRRCGNPAPNACQDAVRADLCVRLAL